MSQIVQVEVGYADLLTGLPPADGWIEVSAPPRFPVLIDEHQTVSAVGGVGVEVVLELGQDAGREGDHPDTGPRFWWSSLQASGHCEELPADPHGPAGKIKIISSECGDLAPAQRGEGLQQQERFPPVGHQVDQGVELIQAQHGPLAGSFLTRALDPAWVDDDQLILGDSGIQDRTHQPVGLGHHGRRDARLEQAGSPFPHRCGVELA